MQIRNLQKSAIGRQTLLCIITLLLTLPVTAQRFRAGITGGPVVTDVYGDDPRDLDNDFNKLGYFLGGFVNTRTSETGALQLEIYLIQKGTSQSPDSNGFGYYHLALDYIEVPLIYRQRINLSISRQPTSSLELQAGISAATLYHSGVEGDHIAVNPDMSFLNKTDISLLAGIGYNFSNHFSFTVRFSNSLNSVFKNSYLSAIYYPTSFDKFDSGHNMVWHFILQYTLGSD